MRSKLVFLLIIFVFIMNGCALILQKGRRSDLEKIESLEGELHQLKNAKDALTRRLSGEIRDKQVKLRMAEKGLVITFVAEVLFNSGKAVLKKKSLPILDKVVKILKKEARHNKIGIEGHTDNEPIKRSKWKSNWELSTQRALGVLYYLEKQGINPRRLSAIGYGEYQPVVSNTTISGRKTNRRVEIVILPRASKKSAAVPTVKKGYSSNVYDEELK